MDHIFDNVGIDASLGTKLRVPNKDYASFPSAALHQGGFHFDTSTNAMYYSDGTTWTKVGIGTVTGFSAGGLSPLFTTSVDFSTTTPHLNFILNSTVSQYQVFGRSLSGVGPPDWVTLSPVAFTGAVTSVGLTASGALSVAGSPITTSGTFALNWTGSGSQYVRGDGVLQALPTIPSVAIPSGELVWGTGTGISSTGAIKQFLNSNLRIGGGGTITGSYGSLVLGNPSINIAPCSLILSENTDTVLTGNGNKSTTFLQGNANYINTDVAGVYDAYRNTVIGIYNVVNATTSSSTDNVVIGSYNTVTGGGANIVFGSYFNASHYGGLYIGDRVNTPIYSTANYEAIFRFYNGFKFYTNNNTTIGLLIAGNRDITMSSLAGSGTRMVVANSTGLLSTQPIPSGSNSVWYIQGTATDATTNAQDIVRTGRVRIGATGTSTYMLSVVGDAYIMNGSIINNNMSYAAFSTAVSPITLAKLDTSNRVQLSQSGVDIILPSYLSSRADSISPVNFLCTNASGVLQSRPVSDLTSSFAMTYASSDVTITSAGGWVNLTFPNTNYALNTTSIYSVNNDGVIVIPNVIKYHRIDVTLQWETTSGTSGSPVIEVRCQVNNTNIYNNPTFIAKPTGVGDIIKCHFYTASTGTVTISCRVTSGASCYIKTRTLSVEDRGNAPG